MKFTSTPLEDLQLASESISESIAMGLGSISHFTDKLAQWLPDIMRGLRGHEPLDRLPAMMPFTGPQKAFLALISQHSYLELREIKAFVPEGLDKPFLDYVILLHAAVQHCSRFYTDTLVPYTTFLAHLVSSPDALRSLNDQGVKNAQLAAQREGFYSHRRSLFGTQPVGRQRVAQVVERNADWSQVLNGTNSVVTQMSQIKRSAIDEQLRQANDYLDILHSKLQKGELPANPEVCKALADGAYQVGAELEFFSVTYYWVLALQGSLNNTMEEVQRVIK